MIIFLWSKINRSNGHIYHFFWVLNIFRLFLVKNWTKSVFDFNCILKRVLMLILCKQSRLAPKVIELLFQAIIVYRKKSSVAWDRSASRSLDTQIINILHIFYLTLFSIHRPINNTHEDPIKCFYSPTHLKYSSG